MNQQPSATRVNRNVRSYEDVLNAWHHYTHRWMDFVTHCPDLLKTDWFYERVGISDQMAVEMRRLVSVWAMLYGTDVVRVILQFVDYPIARKCRRQLFNDDMELDGDRCVTVMLHILENLNHEDKINKTDLIEEFDHLMSYMSVPAYNMAHDIFINRTNPTYMDTP